jgi:hypothetical protein
MHVIDNMRLGDKLRTVDQLREETKDMQRSKGLRHEKQEELENHELAEGSVQFEWREFLRRLIKVAPHLLIKDGAPGNIAIYRRKRPEEYDPEEWDPFRPQWHNDHKYVTGFPKNKLAEFSAITTDKWGVAKREIRGWRTIIIHLIQQKALSYRDAVRAFGEPKGERGWRWHNQLAEHKGI